MAKSASITNLQISGISTENRYNISMRRAQAEEIFQSSRNFSVGNLCYTDSMQDTRCYWNNWALLLQKMGVTDMAASVLEGAGSLRYVAAQLVHASSPFFGNSEASSQWKALATMLEDRELAQQFISFIKEEEYP